jgi:hypothetical protein
MSLEKLNSLPNKIFVYIVIDYVNIWLFLFAYFTLTIVIISSSSSGMREKEVDKQ